MSKSISFSQNGEDVLLRRAFAEKSSGFYVDIGAGHPVEDSVTKYFYDQGWRGINVEPGENFKLLSSQRCGDINLNLCLSDSDGTATFYEFPSALAISTLSSELAERHRRSGWEVHERTVAVTTLAEVCRRYVKQPIDFMSIDVEGHEREVLEGGDWTRWRPRVLLIEATEPCTTIPSHQEWEHILLAADYLFANFDGLNRYFVRSEDRHLLTPLSTPVNVFDECTPYKHVREIEALQKAIDDLQAHHVRHVQQLHDLIGERATQLELLRAEHQRILKTWHKTMQELRTRIAPLEELGPYSVRFARTLHRLSNTILKRSTAMKRLVHARLRFRSS